MCSSNSGSSSSSTQTPSWDLDFWKHWQMNLISAYPVCTRRWQWLLLPSVRFHNGRHLSIPSHQQTVHSVHKATKQSRKKRNICVGNKTVSTCSRTGILLPEDGSTSLFLVWQKFADTYRKPSTPACPFFFFWLMNTYFWQPHKNRPVLQLIPPAIKGCSNSFPEKKRKWNWRLFAHSNFLKHSLN